MEEFQFAEGLDAPERLAFGLAAGPLLGLVAAALAAYALIRSPLPTPVAVAVAAFLVALAAGLGWIRVAGRSAFEWAVFAIQFALRAGPRSFAVTRGEAPRAGSPVIPLFGERDPSPGGTPATPAGASRAAGGARRLTFFSLRGGTGRSTLATELACLLAAGAPGAAEKPQPLRVALLDLDLRSASVSVRLGIPHRSVLDYALAPPDQRRLLDFMVAHHSGAFVLPGPPTPQSPDWPVTPTVLRELLRELDIEGFDVVVIDLPPELTPLTLAALTSADEVFVLLTPTAGGIHDAYRTTDALRKLGLRHALRYVVNRARSDTDVSEPMADLRGHVVGEIPDDDSVVVAENHHRLVALESMGPAATALQRLARRVDREVRFPAVG